METISTTCDSPLIQYLARQAAKRCTDDIAAFDAIAAVMLTCSALEGFLNEVSQVANDILHEHDQAVATQPENVIAILRPLSASMNKAIKDRAPTWKRYDLAWARFAGHEPVLDKGTRQQLSVLTKVRNDLVHIKAARVEYGFKDTDPPDWFEKDGTWGGMAVGFYPQPEWIDSLRETGIVTDDNEHQCWIHRICSQKVADWACSTVQAAVDELIDVAPAGAYQEYLWSHSFCRPLQSVIHVEKEPSGGS